MNDNQTGFFKEYFNRQIRENKKALAMKRVKKILKWVVIVILIMLCTLTITVMGRQNLKYNAPYPDIKASTDTAIIAWGKHLVYSSAHCIDCHHKGSSDSIINAGLEVPLSGGVLFDLPIGKIWSKNITADVETGIGKYTDAEIARALRYGVHPDGTVVFDFMPYHNISDEDMTAIISYLRTQKPVSNKVPTNALNVLGKVAKAFLAKPVGPRGQVPVAVTRDTSLAYGNYLATNVAECNGCHTKRDMVGAFIGEPFAGGAEIEGFITPNITPDSTGRIFYWSKQNFIDRFRMGKLIPKSPMPWNSFGRMTDEELTAIYNFLRSVKPVKTEKK